MNYNKKRKASLFTNYKVVRKTISLNRKDFFITIGEESHELEAWAENWVEQARELKAEYNASNPILTKESAFVIEWWKN